MVIQDAIEGNQFAFIKAQRILDCILIANESVADYRKRKEMGIVIKIDLEKPMIKSIGTFSTKLWPERGSPPNRYLGCLGAYFPLIS